MIRNRSGTSPAIVPVMLATKVVTTRPTPRTTSEVITPGRVYSPQVACAILSRQYPGALATVSEMVFAESVRAYNVDNGIPSIGLDVTEADVDRMMLAFMEGK